MILAGIDIGTNTLRLLIADVGPGSFREINSDRRITRLGQNLDQNGMLSPEAEERSLEALADFQEQLRQEGACHVSSIGTSALRNAANAASFIERVEQETGLAIRVVSGEEEARLTLLGVAQLLPEGGPAAHGKSLLASALVIDIGGGSTEIIITHPRHKPAISSLPLGAVYLTDRFIKHDPPLPEELTSLRRRVADELDAYTGTILFTPPSMCIGTAGTITTLAAIDQGLAVYDPGKINGAVLTGDFIDGIVPRLGALSLCSRRAIPGLEPGREDIILAGAIVAQEIMRRFQCTSMLVSDGGLREGIVLDLYETWREEMPHLGRDLFPDSKR